MAFALSLHVLSAVIWVGGMFFAYMCLRPVAAQQLPPEMRLPLWLATFNRFFLWVWLSAITLLLTGHALIALYGGFKAIGMHVHIMMGLGYLMFALFGHLYFAPFRRMKRLVGVSDWAGAAQQLNKIRMIVAINLGLGLTLVLIASGGRLWH
ncbi:copper resistance protein D [Oleiphilus messinensis]|uniref:Copper resistance protein D n=1 Tax=Oleiphilus messinensis TaxID=141451 RepID=A0A1Y0IF93_9GAMM|nr:CopD family protein [Oleiphilus messinensis]ARU58910.1 copper resistance protein D [Oleiphilus messinensis]